MGISCEEHENQGYQKNCAKCRYEYAKYMESKKKQEQSLADKVPEQIKKDMGIKPPVDARTADIHFQVCLKIAAEVLSKGKDLPNPEQIVAYANDLQVKGWPSNI